jgi:ATP-dependent 26S proteasome regulatory subunit
MFAIRDNRDTVCMIDFERAVVKVMETEETKVVESGVMFA